MNDDTEKSGNRRREAIVLLLFFSIAFIAIPIIKVAAFGGGNIYSRISRWGALRTTIQSEDPGRLAVEDRAEDIEMLASFLWPPESAMEKAEEYYDAWSARSDWVIREASLISIDIAEHEKFARASSNVLLQNVRDFEQYIFATSWVKRDGIWYIAEQEENLIEEYHQPVRTTLRP